MICNPSNLKFYMDSIELLGFLSWRGDRLCFSSIVRQVYSCCASYCYVYDGRLVLLLGFVVRQ